MADFDIGDLVRYSVAFTDAAGIAADPTTVTFQLTLVGGTPANYTISSSPAIVKDSTGAYHIDVAAVAAGNYGYRWLGVGTVQAAVEGNLTILRSYF